MVDDGQSRKRPFAEDGEKKRTVKACDRCKLKKIKCDGAVPCLRCQQRDTICHFGFATGRDEKSISAGHLNQLQLHNEILVKALRLMWERYAQPTLSNDHLKKPSVHDIVASLGVVQPRSGRTHAGFDPSILDTLDLDTYDSNTGISSAFNSSPASQHEHSMLSSFDLDREKAYSSMPSQGKLETHLEPPDLVNSRTSESQNGHSMLPSFDLDRQNAYCSMPFPGKLETDLEPPDLVSSRTSSAATDSSWSSINHFRGLKSAMSTLPTLPQSTQTASLNRPNRPTSKISMPRSFASDFIGQANPGLSPVSWYSQPQSATQPAYAPIDMSMMTPGLDWDSLVDTGDFSSYSPSWGQAVA